MGLDGPQPVHDLLAWASDVIRECRWSCRTTTLDRTLQVGWIAQVRPFVDPQRRRKASHVRCNVPVCKVIPKIDSAGHFGEAGIPQDVVRRRCVAGTASTRLQAYGQRTAQQAATFGNDAPCPLPVVCKPIHHHITDP